ncbi:acetate/propionate family kinase [Arsenicicoccus dermatophilus]|uniref:acetate/propionate family kinase n=1 Tax=Arsenicicoccus dermatophilus TaxID=1076331 RepID=UPI0039170BF6
MPAVLVLNAGSSSLKYQLVQVGTREVLAAGLVEAIGLDSAKITHKAAGDKVSREIECPDHKAAIAAVVGLFDTEGPRLADSDLVAVGHRVVHGGEKFSGAVLVTDELLETLDELTPLAPLHNPANLVMLRAALEMFPELPQVGVFDTAFHQTMPEHAYTYAVPAEWRERYGVRRYGFHGTSHAYVSREAAALLGKQPQDVNVIVLHLGNGASATAVRNGVSVDTSMGLTPLEGLVMGTRSGDIDPAVPMHVHRQSGMSFEDIDTMLYKKSGLQGLAGRSDSRDVEDACEAGDEAARLAQAVMAYRLKKYLGAYAAVLGTLDAVVFTGGIGENSALTRQMATDDLGILGIVVDPALNAVRSKQARDIATPESRVRVFVIPTDEEGEIARQTYEVAQAAGRVRTADAPAS